MSCDPLHFPNIDPDKWGKLKASVEAKIGVDIKTDSGVHKARGFTVSWSYADHTLMVHIIGLPNFISCDFANQLLHHGINSL